MPESKGVVMKVVGVFNARPEPGSSIILIDRVTIKVSERAKEKIKRAEDAKVEIAALAPFIQIGGDNSWLWKLLGRKESI